MAQYLTYIIITIISGLALFGAVLQPIAERYVDLAITDSLKKRDNEYR